MMNGHNQKSPTKKQFIDEIFPKQLKEKLKEQHIMGLVQGFEVANQMLLDYATEHTLEEIVEFCKKNVENKDVVKNMVDNK